MSLRVLEKSKAMDILIQLLICGKDSLPIMQLIERTSGNIGTISTRVGELQAEGWIAESNETTETGRRMISLTPKGKKVAQKVYDLGRAAEKTKLDFTNGYHDSRFFNALKGNPMFPEKAEDEKSP